MNYRHIYHAGNFADVVKHYIITELIISLQKKDSPLTFIDTHAGLGMYDLHDERSVKTMEAQVGILELLNNFQGNNKYLEIVKSLNNSGEIKYYPGSPLITAKLLKEQDKAIACELHPDDYLILKKLFKNNKQVAVHHIDGYLSAKAFIPPKTSRALIIIDPPFEKTNEFASVINYVTEVKKRFRQAVILIWYPIKNNRNDILQFHNGLYAIENVSNCLMLEVKQQQYSEKLMGSGIVIINTPWQFLEDVELRIVEMLKYLSGDMLLTSKWLKQDL